MHHHRTRFTIAAAVALTGSSVALAQDAAPGASPPVQTEETTVDQFAEDPAAVLGFVMEDIGGEPVPLTEYAGRVVLVVNVASKCGLTPQYEALQVLYEQYHDRGLVVLGFPANNFGGQEPGANQEILEFCTGTYHVTFPMFGKISVMGEDQHPLYAKLTAAMVDQGGAPTWNFTKYLVDRSGHVVRRFDPRTAPDDDSVVADIERLLAEPAPEPQADAEETPA